MRLCLWCTHTHTHTHPCTPPLITQHTRPRTRSPPRQPHKTHSIDTHTHTFPRTGATIGVLVWYFTKPPSEEDETVPVVYQVPQSWMLVGNETTGQPVPRLNSTMRCVQKHLFSFSPSFSLSLSLYSYVPLSSLSSFSSLCLSLSLFAALPLCRKERMRLCLWCSRCRRVGCYGAAGP